MRIIEGGQTGVDRGALAAARRHGIRVGGWIPEDGQADDGSIDESLASYVRCVGDKQTRTQLNVVDATGVLVIARGELSGGTVLALDTALTIGRPVMRVDLCRSRSAAAHGAFVAAWIADLPEPRAVNVAGPPEDAAQPIQATVEAILDAAFSHPTLHALATTSAGEAHPSLEEHLEVLYDVRWKDLVFADAKAVAVGVSAASMATAAFLATRPGSSANVSTTEVKDAPPPSLRDELPFSIGVAAGLFAVLLVVSALLPRGEIAPDEKPNRGRGAWLLDFFVCWWRAVSRVFSAEREHDAGTVYYREIAATKNPAELAELAAETDATARIESWSRDIRRLGLTCFYKYRFVRTACVALGVEAAAFAILAISAT